jgi:hypothetical protein
MRFASQLTTPPSNLILLLYVATLPCCAMSRGRDPCCPYCLSCFMSYFTIHFVLTSSFLSLFLPQTILVFDTESKVVSRWISRFFHPFPAPYLGMIVDYCKTFLAILPRLAFSQCFRRIDFPSCPGGTFHFSQLLLALRNFHLLPPSSFIQQLPHFIFLPPFFCYALIIDYVWIHNHHFISSKGSNKLSFTVLFPVSIISFCRVPAHHWRARLALHSPLSKTLISNLFNFLIFFIPVIFTANM